MACGVDGGELHEQMREKRRLSISPWAWSLVFLSTLCLVLPIATLVDGVARRDAGGVVFGLVTLGLGLTVLWQVALNVFLWVGPEGIKEPRRKFIPWKSVLSCLQVYLATRRYPRTL